MLLNRHQNVPRLFGLQPASEPILIKLGIAGYRFDSPDGPRQVRRWWRISSPPRSAAGSTTPTESAPTSSQANGTKEIRTGGMDRTKLAATRYHDARQESRETSAKSYESRYLAHMFIWRVPRSNDRPIAIEQYDAGFISTRPAGGGALSGIPVAQITSLPQLTSCKHVTSTFTP